MLNVTVWMPQIFIFVNALLLGQFWFRNGCVPMNNKSLTGSFVVLHFWQHTASRVSDISIWPLASLQILQQLHYRISLIYVCISYVCTYVYICENLYTFSVWYRYILANFSPKSPQKTSLCSPMRARKGASFANYKPLCIFSLSLLYRT